MLVRNYTGKCRLCVGTVKEHAQLPKSFRSTTISFATLMVCSNNDTHDQIRDCDKAVRLLFEL